MMIETLLYFQIDTYQNHLLLETCISFILTTKLNFTKIMEIKNELY